MTFPVFIPDIICHLENIGELTIDGLAVSKKSSNWMWNCGETNPICKFSIVATDDVCLVEGPRLIPRISLDSHLGCLTPA